jgi:hypothetical protein
MKDVESELAKKMAAVLLDSRPGDERAALLVQTKQLAEERITLGNEVDRLQQQLHQQEENLAEHREQLMTQL